MKKISRYRIVIVIQNVFDGVRMKFFQLVVRQNLDRVVDHLHKKKHYIAFRVLEKLLSLLSHLYKKMVDENHSIESKHLSAISLAATMIIFYCFKVEEKITKNTVLLKK